ncbi:MAG: hypothetical protein QM758_16000 [Armatimonas sp.]
MSDELTMPAAPPPPDAPEDAPVAVGGDHGPKIEISDEMRGSYLRYGMSVIVSRALPDVRDGLKPVQRRILDACASRSLPHLSVP